MCIVAWSLKGNNAQVFYLCNIVPRVSPPGKHCTGETLCSVALEAPGNVA